MVRLVQGTALVNMQPNDGEDDSDSEQITNLMTGDIAIQMLKVARSGVGQNKKSKLLKLF